MEIFGSGSFWVIYCAIKTWALKLEYIIFRARYGKPAQDLSYTFKNGEYRPTSKAYPDPRLLSSRLIRTPLYGPNLTRAGIIFLANTPRPSIGDSRIFSMWSGRVFMARFGVPLGT